MKVKENKHNLTFNHYIASYIRKRRQVLEYATNAEGILLNKKYGSLLTILEKKN